MEGHILSCQFSVNSDLGVIVMRFDACAYETRAEVTVRDKLGLFGTDLEAEGIHGLLWQWNACLNAKWTNLTVSAYSPWTGFIGKAYVKVKVKWSRYRAGVAQRVGRGIALVFHDHGTRRGWVVSSTPRPHFTPGKHPVPILQEAGWAPGPVWTGGKSRPHRIRSRTVQPVVSPYTDWATWPTKHMYCTLN